MEISELEFVQMIIILLVMTIIIVMIICLLNHYWLSALAFLSRLSHSQREQATQLDASVWSDSVNAEVMRSQLNRNLPCFKQQQQLCRFQPTYPHLPQEIINLPPIICLSDGEELPYKGPCSLQLRHPEQQLELIRAAVRAPPNQTVFDCDLIDIYIHSKRLQACKSNSRTKDASARMEAPPPSYSAVMGDYPVSTVRHSQYSNNAPPTNTRLGPISSQTVFHAPPTDTRVPIISSQTEFHAPPTDSRVPISSQTEFHAPPMDTRVPISSQTEFHAPPTDTGVPISSQTVSHAGS